MLHMLCKFSNDPCKEVQRRVRNNRASRMPLPRPSGISKYLGQAFLNGMREMWLRRSRIAWKTSHRAESGSKRRNCFVKVSINTNNKSMIMGFRVTVSSGANLWNLNLQNTRSFFVQFMFVNTIFYLYRCNDLILLLFWLENDKEFK